MNCPQTTETPATTKPQLTKAQFENARAMFLAVMEESGELDEALTVAILAAIHDVTKAG